MNISNIIGIGIYEHVKLTNRTKVKEYKLRRELKLEHTNQHRQTKHSDIQLLILSCNIS